MIRDTDSLINTTKLHMEYEKGGSHGSAGKLLHGCIRQMAKADSFEVALNYVLKSMLTFFGADRAYIYEFDWENKVYDNTFEQCAQGVEPKMEELQNLPLKSIQMWLRLIECKSLVVVDSVSRLKDKPARQLEYQILKKCEMNSLIVAAIMENNQLIGIWGIENPRRNMTETDVINSYAFFLVSELRKSRMQNELKHLQFRDPVTGILNRIALEQYIKDNKVAQGPWGLLLIEVDQYRKINRVDGRTVAQKLLVQTAKYLQVAFLHNESLFQMSENCFAVLIPDAGADMWEQVCTGFTTIHEALYRFNSASIPASLSGGLIFMENALFDEMYERAEDALHYCQETGSSGCALISANGEIIKEWHDARILQKQEKAFFQNSMGMWKVEAFEDAEKFEFVYANSELYHLLGAPLELSPKELFTFWKERINQAYYESVLEMWKKTSKAGHAELIYPWEHPTQGATLIRCGGVYTKGDDGKGYICGYHQDLRNLREIDHNANSQLMLEAINNLLLSSYYISLEDERFEIVKGAEVVEPIKDTSLKASVILKKGTEEFVSDAFKEQMMQFVDFSTLKERIQDQGFIECEYLSSSNRGWCKAMFFPVKKDADGKVSHVLYMVMSIDEEKKRVLAISQRNAERVEVQKQAADIVNNSRNLMVGIVDKRTGELRLSGKDDNKIYLFREAIKKEANYVVEEERRNYLQIMEMDYILDQIAIHGKFEHKVHVSLPGSDVKCVSYHFAEYNQDVNYFLVIIEDITEKTSWDNLTDVLNMNGFLRYLKECLNQEDVQDELVVCALNIQNFKALNKQFGYQVGDEILKKVAEEIHFSELFPKAVCREMSDQFFCLVRRDKMEEAAIEQMCKMQLQIQEQSISVSLHCGIYYVESGMKDPKQVCDCARAVLKENMRNSALTYSVYDEALKHRYMTEATIMQRFEQALKDQEFIVAYQPVYNSQTGKIVSAEALVRWNHPEEGILEPNLFLPILEKEGRISDLDCYVEQAVAQFLQKRMEANKRMIPIAINLSRFDLQKQSVLDRLINVLNQGEVPCEYMRFEVTESGSLNIPEIGETFLEQIRERGSYVLIDDFGSGFSSLGSLATRNFDVVKLDMSFTNKIGKNIRSEAVIQGTIHMSHQLGAQVIAEGVETDEQYQFLKANDCDFVQGYYFSKPVFEDAFVELLDQE